MCVCACGIGGGEVTVFVCDTHTETRAHARTHARTHMHTCTHTLFALSLFQFCKTSLDDSVEGDPNWEPEMHDGGEDGNDALLDECVNKRKRAKVTTVPTTLLAELNTADVSGSRSNRWRGCELDVLPAMVQFAEQKRAAHEKNKPNPVTA